MGGPLQVVAVRLTMVERPRLEEVAQRERLEAAASAVRLTRRVRRRCLIASQRLTLASLVLATPIVPLLVGVHAT